MIGFIIVFSYRLGNRNLTFSQIKDLAIEVKNEQGKIVISFANGFSSLLARAINTYGKIYFDLISDWLLQTALPKHLFSESQEPLKPFAARFLTLEVFQSFCSEKLTTDSKHSSLTFLT